MHSSSRTITYFGSGKTYPLQSSGLRYFQLRGSGKKFEVSRFFAKDGTENPSPTSDSCGPRQPTTIYLFLVRTSLHFAPSPRSLFSLNNRLASQEGIVTSSPSNELLSVSDSELSNLSRSPPSLKLYQHPRFSYLLARSLAPISPKPTLCKTTVLPGQDFLACLETLTPRPSAAPSCSCPGTLGLDYGRALSSLAVCVPLRPPPGSDDGPTRHRKCHRDAPHSPFPSHFYFSCSS